MEVNLWMKMEFRESRYEWNIGRRVHVVVQGLGDVFSLLRPLGGGIRKERVQGHRAKSVGGSPPGIMRVITSGRLISKTSPVSWPRLWVVMLFAWKTTARCAGTKLVSRLHPLMFRGSKLPGTWVRILKLTNEKPEIPYFQARKPPSPPHTTPSTLRRPTVWLQKNVLKDAQLEPPPQRLQWTVLSRTEPHSHSVIIFITTAVPFRPSCSPWQLRCMKRKRMDSNTLNGMT
ncbi:hypothetical protein B0T20DRAFT_31729 [Sordaria brevicollis]|uniref:Uncharacterized protein n=1 Tax=Sordaria brevicollis TaxID=83679 RepID=A0AAE0U936_SORBR|nr:hypothetical protein B0T20DRAFT_31729 [Sordaria brevicollis]